VTRFRTYLFDDLARQTVTRTKFATDITVIGVDGVERSGAGCCGCGLCHSTGLRSVPRMTDDGFVPRCELRLMLISQTGIPAASVRKQARFPGERRYGLCSSGCVRSNGCGRRFWCRQFRCFCGCFRLSLSDRSNGSQVRSISLAWQLPQ
jgi:hypothetical protein